MTKSHFITLITLQVTLCPFYGAHGNWRWIRNLFLGTFFKLKYLEHIISKMDTISRNIYISQKVTEAHFMARTSSPKYIILFLATAIYHRRWPKPILWRARPLKKKQKFRSFFGYLISKIFKGLSKTKNSFVIIAEKMGRNCPNLVQKLPEMVDNDGK